MNTLDFSPLFRTAIGFDRLARTLETARASAEPQGYPPYNIEKTAEDSYVLTLAIAGFGPDDLEIVAQDNVLTVSGRAPQATNGTANAGSFLHRGIAGRAFERRFALADHIVVDGANLEHGLLQLTLKRVVPEALKPRRIPVQPGLPSRAQAQVEAPQAQAPQAQAA
jgi:molecular chaperone IbpA